MDFITKLPLSGGHDTILTIMDTDCSKASIFIPCHETIDSEGVARLYLNHVVPHYGIPHKIISDRDVRFTSKFSSELCRLLDIKQNLSTAYHPQTDGASERTNQSLEQYLRIFCGTQQDNWHAWLPLAQYVKNSWPSATTKKTPFDLLIGYTPRIHQPTRKTDIPSFQQRLSLIEETRKAAQEAQYKAQESWITDKPRHKPFSIGTQVWLEGTNLKLPSNITPKLAPRRYGPFKVVSQVLPVAYKLQLPQNWQIHDVFHASLLTPYKETEQHGPNFLEPPPDIIEGEPEWEVEKIIKMCLYGRWKKKQYLVRWKDYSPTHDSWVNEEDLHTPELLADFQQPSSSIKTLQFDKQTTSRCSPLLTTPSTPPMSTNMTNTPSSPNRPWSGMETSPFSRRSSPQDVPQNIAGQVASLMDVNIASKPSTVTPTNQDEHTFTIAVSSTPPLPTNSPSSAPIPPPPSTPAVSLNLAVPSALPRQGSDLYHYLIASRSALPPPTEPENPPSSSPVVSQMPSPDPRPMLQLFHSLSVQNHPTEFPAPTLEDVSDVCKRCRALLRAIQNPGEDSEAYKAWTEGLMPAVHIFANNVLSDENFYTTYKDFENVQHLFFVPQILDRTNPFMSEPSVSDDEPMTTFVTYVPTTSYRPSPSSSFDPPLPIHALSTSELDDPDHPGEGWALYSSDPNHYPLTFLNEQGHMELAKYITYRDVGDETQLVGVRKKGDPEYSIPLHSRTCPSPNLSGLGLRDTDLSIFSPDSPSIDHVNHSLLQLNDAGVIADVHRFRKYTTRRKQIARVKEELEEEEERLVSKTLEVEKYLAHAAVCTHLQPHLVSIRPRTPPSRRIPRIFAAQGPPNIEDEEKENDLESRWVRAHMVNGPKSCQVLGKCIRSPSPFPYYLRCQETQPGHPTNECPLWKTCRWCLSINHSHDDCPKPHKACKPGRCVVRFDHRNIGERCLAKPITALEYEIELAMTDLCEKGYSGSD